jgi:hypothetical protein
VDYLFGARMQKEKSKRSKTYYTQALLKRKLMALVARKRALVARRQH